jgi:hypothetical protein
MDYRLGTPIANDFMMNLVAIKTVFNNISMSTVPIGPNQEPVPWVNWRLKKNKA